jgi:type I restriction enzyme M protein
VETPEKNDIPALLETWKTYKASGFSVVPGIEAGSLLEAGSVEPSSWWTTTETLAEVGYNLGAGQWKPRIAEAVSDEDPVDLVAEVLADYKKVVAGLEKLKAELAE